VQTLKKRADYLRVQSGPKWVTPAFILQGRLRDAPGEATAAAGDAPRFGFTVSSRSVSQDREGARKRGTAVDRNRARRRLKEAVRLIAPECADPRMDYVVIGRAPALRRNFDELLADMRLAFHKIKAKAQGGRPDRMRDLRAS